jgi:hypothetical protein
MEQRAVDAEIDDLDAVRLHAPVAHDLVLEERGLRNDERHAPERPPRDPAGDLQTQPLREALSGCVLRARNDVLDGHCKLAAREAARRDVARQQPALFQHHVELPQMPIGERVQRPEITRKGLVTDPAQSGVIDRCRSGVRLDLEHAQAGGHLRIGYPAESHRNVRPLGQRLRQVHHVARRTHGGKQVVPGNEIAHTQAPTVHAASASRRP